MQVNCSPHICLAGLLTGISIITSDQRIVVHAGIIYKLGLVMGNPVQNFPTGHTKFCGCTRELILQNLVW